MATPAILVTRRAAERFRAGHPWIYRADLLETRGATGGDTVLVLSPPDTALGYALYSDRSEIALRLVTRQSNPPGLDVWRTRLGAALAYREAMRIDATAYRLAHGEGDLLPSLVIDRYDDYLVVQALSQATERLLPDLVTILADMAAPRGILARNDPRVRQLEGLDRRVDVLHGDVPERVEVREGPIVAEADLWKGQKTGLFLDQRENREAAAEYARARVLDCFAYNGGFALRLAARCEHVIAIDISEAAVARIRTNAARNALSNVEARAGNVFDALRQFDRRRERFDTIVLDPPAFAKNKTAVPKALAGYKEINLRALRILSPGGYLVTCSCSYHVDEATFGEVIYDAAIDAHASVQVVEKRMQSRDHPVLLGVPETYYLKCFILRKLA